MNLRFFKAALALVAAAIMPLVPAAAQTPPPPPPFALDAAKLDRMCNPEGAMQYKFGQAGVPGGGRIMRLMAKPMVLPDGYGPFVHARAASTEWSGQFMEMAYSVALKDKSLAEALIVDVMAIADTSGWEWFDGTMDDTPLYLAGYADSDSFYKKIGDGADAPLLMLSVSHFAGELTLSCGRSDLLKIHAGEAFGKLPPGTPRPTVPEIPVPPLRTAAQCSEPAALAELEAFMAGRSIDEITAAMVARTTYRDRLTAWMLWKLDESGKLTSEELIKLAFGGVAAGSPGGDPFASFKMIEEMFPIIDKLGKAEVAKDMPAICRAMNDFHGWMTRVDAITLAQTKSAQATLTAEAKRLGVSFE
jgi:hypothetical protein